MENDRPGFRDRLLALQETTPELKKQYQWEVQRMLERPLSGVRRWVWLGVAIFGGASAIACVALAVLAPGDLPPTARGGLIVGALFGLAWSALGVRVFVRSAIDLRWDTGVYAGLSWVLPVLLATFCLVFAPQGEAGLRMILTSLVFLVGGAVFLIRHVVELSELKTREKLLDLEFRLAELSETLKKRT
jgi:hypothetical protein